MADLRWSDTNPHNYDWVLPNVPISERQHHYREWTRVNQESAHWGDDVERWTPHNYDRYNAAFHYHRPAIMARHFQNPEIERIAHWLSDNPDNHYVGYTRRLRRPRVSLRSVRRRRNFDD